MGLQAAYGALGSCTGLFDDERDRSRSPRSRSFANPELGKLAQRKWTEAAIDEVNLSKPDHERFEWDHRTLFDDKYPGGCLTFKEKVDFADAERSFLDSATIFSGFTDPTGRGAHLGATKRTIITYAL